MKRLPPIIALIRENRWYFIASASFFVAGAILLLLMQTGDETFFFSARRSAFGDGLFRYSTKLGEELSYFLALGILLFVRFRHALALPLLGLLVTILSYWTKAFFQHDRPKPFLSKLGTFDELNLVEGVVVHSGANGFPSGHAMSAFALSTFLALCLPAKRRLGPALFGLALLVGISRIYLVQHFLKDVYLGAAMGMLLAIGWYYLHHLPRAHWLDRRWRWKKARV
jgi:membrane-associated phospholipid phosphatase